nr:YfbU family protein [uncultured Gellertiella sp.]
MDRVQRLILWNQFELLKAQAEPYAAADFELKQQILLSGFTTEYHEVFTSFSEVEASESMQREVLDILEMFRALDNAMQRGWVPSAPGNAKFRGFDGNNDDHSSFAHYLLDKKGFYQESSPNRNSHSSSTIGTYRRMLVIWRASSDKHQLTNVEAEQIISA